MGKYKYLVIQYIIKILVRGGDAGGLLIVIIIRVWRNQSDVRDWKGMAANRVVGVVTVVS